MDILETVLALNLNFTTTAQCDFVLDFYLKLRDKETLSEFVKFTSGYSLQEVERQDELIFRRYFGQPNT